MEIGGYFELELHSREPYYPDLIALNSGRSCLEYILKASNYSKLYLPYYICEVVIEPIRKLRIDVSFYSINIDFTIKDAIILKDSEALLYVNYFGLMDDYIISLSEDFNHLIIDNAQAFFSKPKENVITYYSPRKFFGVSDGGYLSTKKFIDFKLEKDTSFQNANYLLERADIGAEKGYQNFRANEERFRYTGLKRMSKLTSDILSSIDYDLVKLKREENFWLIHQELGFYNQLSFIPRNIAGPMIYPLLTNNVGLRDFLISNKIYIAKYWDNVNRKWPENGFEDILANQLIALPVDQRYGMAEMMYIVDLVKSFCNF